MLFNSTYVDEILIKILFPYKQLSIYTEHLLYVHWGYKREIKYRRKSTKIMKAQYTLDPKVKFTST
jgi:hypothetical protein